MLRETILKGKHPVCLLFFIYLTACGGKDVVDNRVVQGYESGDSTGNAIPGLDTCQADYTNQFVEQIRPELTSRGCVGCHVEGGVAGTTSIRFDLSDEDLFAAILAFDIGDNGDHRILQKLSGSLAHTGGALIASTDPFYSVFESFLSEARHASCSPEDSQLDCGDHEGLIGPRLWRLTQLQYENTLRLVLGEEVLRYATDLGDDYPTIGLSNTATTLGLDLIVMEDILTSNTEIARHAVAQQSDWTNCMAAGENGCFYNLGLSYGTRLWRRPLLPEESQTLNGFIDDLANQGQDRESIGIAIMEYLLSSPNFWYRFELGIAADGVRELGPYEVASLLSYTFWNEPPDSTLIDLAAQGTLLTAQILSQQLQRLLADPKAEVSFSHFIRDWLKLDGIITVEKSGSYGQTLTESARQDLLASVDRYIQVKVFEEGADFSNFMSDQHAFINSNTAPLFGLSSVGMTQSMVRHPVEHRRGLLTHPAFLSTISNPGSTNIVRRGVFLLEQVLGVELPAPPPSAQESITLPDGFDADTLTSRQLLEVYHSHRSECSGCHNMIDPVGSAFENYDPTGLFRTTEKQGLAIDAAGRFDAGNESFAFDNATELIGQLAESERVRDHFLGLSFAYFFGLSSSEHYQCETDRLEQEFALAGYEVRSLLQGLSKLDNISRRALTGDAQP